MYVNIKVALESLFGKIFVLAIRKGTAVKARSCRSAMHPPKPLPWQMAEKSHLQPLVLERCRRMYQPHRSAPRLRRKRIVHQSRKYTVPNLPGMAANQTPWRLRLLYPLSHAINRPLLVLPFQVLSNIRNNPPALQSIRLAPSRTKHSVRSTHWNGNRACLMAMIGLSKQPVFRL
jgi:hypothetical protein